MSEQSPEQHARQRIDRMLTASGWLMQNHHGRLRHFIRKRAFEGKLVPQDPADEPALALLDRIESQCSNQTHKKTRTPRAAGRVRRKEG